MTIAVWALKLLRAKIRMKCLVYQQLRLTLRFGISNQAQLQELII